MSFIYFTDEEPPRFKSLKPVFYVKEGEKLNIELDVPGTPTANITCYREDENVLFCPGKTIDNTDVSPDAVACSNNEYSFTGVHQLVIKATTFLLNNGKYRCEARNIVGNDTVYFRVNVTGANNLQLLQVNRLITDS